MVWFGAYLRKLTYKVHLVIVGSLIVRAAREANLIRELIRSLLVLALDFDGMDNFLESAAIVE